MEPLTAACKRLLAHYDAVHPLVRAEWGLYEVIEEVRREVESQDRPRCASCGCPEGPDGLCTRPSCRDSI